MFWSSERVLGFTLHAPDGRIGRVSDILFDDASWTVRYLVADTSQWLIGRRVLLSPEALGTPALEQDEVTVRLSKKAIEDSPPLAADEPVSRQHELDLSGYFGWAPYWSSAILTPQVVTRTKAGRDVTAAAAAKDGPEADPHLRSIKEVTGYRILAGDEPVGRANDFLFDAAWRVRYIVVLTGFTLTGRSVVVSPRWASRIDWPGQEIAFDLTKAEIEGSPPYSGIGQEVDSDDYEELLRRHYGRLPE